MKDYPFKELLSTFIIISAELSDLSNTPQYQPPQYKLERLLTQALYLWENYLIG